MAQSAPNQVFQDFQPFFEWSEDETSATLVVMLPGFTKEHLKVQVTSTPVLRINGQRQVAENTWRRFAKEFSIPPYCDTNEVSAKFERGILTIKFPKLITPAYKPQPQQAPVSSSLSSLPSSPHDQLPQQDEKQPINDEKENKTQESPQEEKGPISDDNEKAKNNKTEHVVAKNDGVSETAQQGIVASKAQEKPKAKLTQRLKTRVLDFSVSLRSGEDQDVKQGFCGIGKSSKKLKRPKILLNIIVAILLVMVLGLYVKNAFWSSKGEGESKNFQEF
ncbi:hypothetical protein RJT34_11195 [Clitoria ternatea]|uniref:SHSP domain-containing protein n=1 Tax=Clitoria ternatea TaxID=43366 RepID=A0AAN9PJA3_CLITE